MKDYGTGTHCNAIDPVELMDLVEGKASPQVEARLRKHIDTCEECQEKMEFFVDFSEVAKDVEANPEKYEDLRDTYDLDEQAAKLQKQLDAKRTKVIRMKKAKRYAAILAPLAAALLGIFWMFSDGIHPNSKPPVSQTASLDYFKLLDFDVFASQGAPANDLQALSVDYRFSCEEPGVTEGKAKYYIGSGPDFDPSTATLLKEYASSCDQDNNVTLDLTNKPIDPNHFLFFCMEDVAGFKEMQVLQKKQFKKMKTR